MESGGSDVIDAPAVEPEPTPADTPATPEGESGEYSASVEKAGTPFTVHLDAFEGPFDLLLQLISKHELDVTLIALSQVTDEFIAHLRAMGDQFDLSQTTEFLVVAATLLDLKAARLLPSGEVEDEEDLALLEARDLLFARLLQYRAFKQASSLFVEMLRVAALSIPRSVGLEPHLAAALPEVVIQADADQLAQIAANALRPKEVPTVGVDHLHVPRVSVREHLIVVAERLQTVGTASFRALCAGCTETIEVVARFLAVLELYREGAVAFEQLEAMGELRVRWTAAPGIVVGRHLDGDDNDYSGTVTPVEVDKDGSEVDESTNSSTDGEAGDQA